MAKCWKAIVVAVALLACSVGLEAQETVWSNPPLQQRPQDWNPPNVFPQRTDQTNTGNVQSQSQGLPQANPQTFPSRHRWTPGAQPRHPSQSPYRWNKPLPRPAYPLPAQSGFQWTKPGSPLPPQTGQGSASSPPVQGSSQFNPNVPGQSGVKPPPYHQGPQIPQNPVDPSALNCNIAANVQVTCGPSDISADDCHAINCCFDGNNCYFGKAVTVQCTKDGQFIVVVAKDTTLPTIDLESISLLGTGQGCNYVDSNSQFVIYQFAVTDCGSQVTEDFDTIVYQNRLSCSYEVGSGPYGAITRDSQFELLFQCKYSGSSDETVIAEVVKLDNPFQPVAALGPISVQLRLGNGQCQTKGCSGVDAAYTSYYMDADYPVTKVLRDPVYVEVQLMDKTDPLLALILGRCWVTTSPNPDTLPQWDILINGCPYKDDRYLSTIVPIGPSAGLDYPTHYKRFFFQMFTFVDNNLLSPLTQQIYIHCSTDVCDVKPGNTCEPSCNRQRRDVGAVAKESAVPRAVGSVGPVLMSKADE